MSKTDAQINEFRAVFELAAEALNTRAPDRQSEYLSLYLNHISLELSLHHTEDAISVCQDAIRKSPRAHELWIMYATIVETAGKIADAVLIFNGLASKFEDNFAVWNAFARLQLSHKGADEAVSVLKNSIEPFINSVCISTSGLFCEQICTSYHTNREMKRLLVVQLHESALRVPDMCAPQYFDLEISPL